MLPKFADFFKGLGAKLPLTTRILIGLANFTKDYWWFVPIGVFFVCVGVILWLAKSARGRRVRDRLLLKIAGRR